MKATISLFLLVTLFGAASHEALGVKLNPTVIKKENSKLRPGTVAISIENAACVNGNDLYHNEDTVNFQIVYSLAANPWGVEQDGHELTWSSIEQNPDPGELGCGDRLLFDDPEMGTLFLSSLFSNYSTTDCGKHADISYPYITIQPGPHYHTEDYIIDARLKIWNPNVSNYVDWATPVYDQEFVNCGEFGGDAPPLKHAHGSTTVH